MNVPPPIMTHLQRAEEHVEKARNSWDATDLARCAACVEYLRQAAGEIEAAQRCTGDAPAGRAKDRLERLQGSVNRLGRLVDSAIAFQRGLALHTGMDEVVSPEQNR